MFGCSFLVEELIFIDMSGKNLKWGKEEFKKIIETNNFLKALFLFIKLKRQNRKVKLTFS